MTTGTGVRRGQQWDVTFCSHPQFLPSSWKALLQHFVCICLEPLLSNCLTVTIFNLVDTSRLTWWWKYWVKSQSAATDLSITDLDCQIWTQLCNLNPLRPHVYTRMHTHTQSHTAAHPISSLTVSSQASADSVFQWWTHTLWWIQAKLEITHAGERRNKKNVFKETHFLQD